MTPLAELRAARDLILGAAAVPQAILEDAFRVISAWKDHGSLTDQERAHYLAVAKVAEQRLRITP